MRTGKGQAVTVDTGPSSKIPKAQRSWRYAKYTGLCKRHLHMYTRMSAAHQKTLAGSSCCTCTESVANKLCREDNMHTRDFLSKQHELLGLLTTRTARLCVNDPNATAQPTPNRLLSNCMHAQLISSVCHKHAQPPSCLPCPCSTCSQSPSTCHCSQCGVHTPGVIYAGSPALLLLLL